MNTQIQEADMQENTMRDYARILFKRKKIIIATFITGMLGVFIGLGMNVMVYEGRVKILISAEKQSESPYYKDLTGRSSAEMVMTQSEIVRSNPVIERAVKALGLYKRDAGYETQFALLPQLPLIKLKQALFALIGKLLNSEYEEIPAQQQEIIRIWEAMEALKSIIVVTPVENTNMFTITVTDFTPLGAAVLANVISRSYVIFDLEQQLAGLGLKYGEKHPSYIQLKDNIEKMFKSLSGEPLANIEAIGPASIKIIEQAPMPLQPVWIPNVLIIAAAFFISIFLGVVFVFIFEAVDQTFKSPQEIERFLKLPFLGAISLRKPAEKILITDNGLESPYAQSYQRLSEHIYLLMKEKNIKSLMLASAIQSEGATTAVANIAAYLSGRLGHKVLVIDANLRDPSIHKIFKLQNNFGFAEILEGKAAIEKATKNIGQNLAVITAGVNGALEPLAVFNSSLLNGLINTAKEKYDIILVDSANMKNFKDGAILASHLDAVALLIKEGVTRRAVVRKSIEPLKQGKANIIGAILNNHSFVIPKAIYDKV